MFVSVLSGLMCVCMCVKCVAAAAAAAAAHRAEEAPLESRLS